MSKTKHGGLKRAWLPRMVPIALMLGAFLFFVKRDREEIPAPGPEDVLLNMAVALGDGNVEDFLACFGGRLEPSLRTIVESNERQDVSRWLKNRGTQIKGFAITDVATIDPNRVLVKTETVYRDRNTGQEFELELEEGQWKIVRSDFEAVQEWETNFGKPIWEVQ